MDRRAYLKTSLALGSSFLIPAGALSLVGCSGTARVPELAGFDGNIMGTSYSVRLGTAVSVPEGLAAKTHQVLQKVDQQMSTWKSNSELSKLNSSDTSDWQVLSPETFQVIAHAQATSNLSQGTFDVTVGPLIDLWGFGAGANTIEGSANGAKPSQAAIRTQLAAVGADSLDLDATNSAVKKLNAATQVDLSGIAKGHAVDQVAALLDAEGIDSYLVEVGGELLAKGIKSNNEPWRVAIERPLAGQRDVFRVIDLKNGAIATSGDYRNFFDHGGQRFSHSIDPRTGAPVNHELASVSVVANSTMEADALSTAMMVMGPDDAMNFATQHQIAAQFILKSGSALKEVYSPQFESVVL